MNHSTEYIEIQDIEQILKNSLPDCHLTGTLEDNGTLSIRKGPAACHTKILLNKFLEYDYGANIRDMKISGILIASLFIPFIGTYILWYLLDYYFSTKASEIGYRVEQILEEHNIDLRTYIEN